MSFTARFFVSLIVINLVCIKKITAQPQTTFYTDIGKNNVSKSPFIKAAVLYGFGFGKNIFEAGLQTEIKSNSEYFVSGYRVTASRHLAVAQKQFLLKGFFIQTSNSWMLRETNWGALIGLNHRRFDLEIGTDFRTYAFKDKAVSDFQIEKNARRFVEPFNLTYSLTYDIKVPLKDLNVGVAITNIDQFKVEQETNPLFRLDVHYQLNKSCCVLTQFWYEPAGVFNIYANYFGFFVRTGIVWKLERN